MRLRLRLRSLLILVAAVAVVLGIERMRRRSSYCRKKAVDYAGKEAEILGLAARREADAAFWRRRVVENKVEAEEADLDDRRVLEEFVESTLEMVNILDSDVKRFRQRAAYYAELKEKYCRVAACPWLPMGPDSRRGD